MSSSFPSSLSSVNVEQLQVWSTLFDVMSTTLKESYGIALYSSGPTRYCIEEPRLCEHWCRQSTCVASVLEAIIEVNPIFVVNNEELVEPYRRLNALLLREMLFQSELQQNVEAFLNEHPEGEEFDFFLALLEYLHGTQAAIAGRMYKLRVEITRLATATTEDPGVLSTEVGAA